MSFDAGIFDIAVIGAGHAGIEAALAGARLGLKTACFTMNLDAIGNMPCNPAIGGTAKAIWCAKLTRLAEKWAKPLTRPVSSTVCSTAAKARRCIRCVRRPTALITESI